MDREKIYKTIEIVVKAVVAIAAVWLCVSCTMSMSISKNNTNIISLLSNHRLLLLILLLLI